MQTGSREGVGARKWHCNMVPPPPPPTPTGAISQQPPSICKPRKRKEKHNICYNYHVLQAQPGIRLCSRQGNSFFFFKKEMFFMIWFKKLKITISNIIRGLKFLAVWNLCKQFFFSDYFLAKFHRSLQISHFLVAESGW